MSSVVWRHSVSDMHQHSLLIKRRSCAFALLRFALPFAFAALPFLCSLHASVQRAVPHFLLTCTAALPLHMRALFCKTRANMLAHAARAIYLPLQILHSRRSFWVISSFIVNSFDLRLVCSVCLPMPSSPILIVLHYDCIILWWHLYVRVLSSLPSCSVHTLSLIQPATHYYILIPFSGCFSLLLLFTILLFLCLF